MATVQTKNKKGTVIHRTTSETLRLGEDALAGQIRGSTIPRKKSQVTSPSCSFQITGVMTRYDLEDESADDLDESHTDEISRVTDNETPSFSEDSKDDQQPVGQSPPSQQTIHNQNITNANSVPIFEKNLVHAVKEEEKKDKIEKPKSNINDLGRFRVVKLGSMVPFSRGRWTCYDYLDESAEGKTPLNINSSVTTISCWSTTSQPTYLYTGSILMPEEIPIFVPLSTNSLHPLSSENLPKSRHVSFTSCNSVDTVINNSNLDSNQNKQIYSTVAQNHEIVTSNNDLPSSNDNSCVSVPSSTTIDTKIEHALDVVKNHLTHAVRLEVEELKVKINELVERISHLEYENDVLRANVTPEVLATLGNIRKH